MPETRFTEEYYYPQDIPASEKTVENARTRGWVKQIPYEVSDGQIEAEIEVEAREVAIKKLADKEKAAIRAKRGSK